MVKEEIQFTGSSNRPVTADLTLDPGQGNNQPVIIYAHGFNGFKDWGNGDLLAQQFAAAGFAFFKFNFSHNGTTPAQLQDFADLEAFGRNNYTRQLEDLGKVLDWLQDGRHALADMIDTTRTGLIGHSMGGGLSIIKTAEDDRIKALATWASISQCKTPWASWTDEKINAWEKEGVAYYTNGRTQQQMPLYYQLYEDFQRNSERLDIGKAARRIKVPFLICHGTKDSSVAVDSAYTLHTAQPESQLFLLASDHVFGRKHPWSEPVLPGAMLQVLRKNIVFFQKALQ